MDNKENYSELMEKLKQELPITAYPTRELVQIFRNKGNPITLHTKLMITEFYNTGDISGIMCIVEENENNKIACALTHLILTPGFKLHKEVIDYQKKRMKRVMQLQKISGNKRMP